MYEAHVDGPRSAIGQKQTYTKDRYPNAVLQTPSAYRITWVAVAKISGIHVHDLRFLFHA